MYECSSMINPAYETSHRFYLVNVGMLSGEWNVLTIDKVVFGLNICFIRTFI